MKRNFILFVFLFVSFFSLFAQTQEAHAFYRAKEYGEAIKICESLINNGTANIDTYTIMCWSLVAKREYARAEQIAYEGLKLNRYDIRLIEILGEAKYYLGKNNEAMKQFQEYLSIAPDRTGARVDTAYYFMGEIYIRQSKFQHADIALSAAVRKRTQSSYWWTRLGYAREMAGNFYEAITAYEEALKLDPMITDAINGKKRVFDRLR